MGLSQPDLGRPVPSAAIEIQHLHYMLSLGKWGGGCSPERGSDLLLVTQQVPQSLSQAESISVGYLASGRRVCCSHLPSAALQILISTSGLPLLALPWRPLWIFPRQTFLHGLSAQVQSPRGWGTSGPTLGIKKATGSWAVMAWEQEAGSEQASHYPERSAGGTW